VSPAPARSAGARRLPTVAELRGGPLPPVVLFTGRGESFEEYLMEDAFRLFWDHAVDAATADFNRDLFYADEVRAEELFAQAGSFPMMAERRLVVLRRCEKAPAALLNDLLVYLERPSPSTCLLLVGHPLDRRRKVWQRVLKEAAVHEFTTLSLDQLTRWLAEASLRRGRRLPERLAAQLAEQLGPAPLRMADQEVEKLCLLAGDREEIAAEDLATALGMEDDANAFDLVNAVLDQDAPRALRILRSLLRVTDQAYLLAGTLGRSFSRLWFTGQLRARGIASEDIAARLNLKPGQVSYSLPRLRRWTPERLEEALRLVLEADMALKGDSPLSAVQIHTQLVVRLCRTT